MIAGVMGFLLQGKDGIATINAGAIQDHLGNNQKLHPKFAEEVVHLEIVEVVHLATAGVVHSATEGVAPEVCKHIKYTPTNFINILQIVTIGAPQVVGVR